MVNVKGCLKKLVNGILYRFLYVLDNFTSGYMGFEFFISVCDYALSTSNIYFASVAGIDVQRRTVPCARG